ncbi:hypothetical protein DCAR_0521260 [Daucus carota subsp. sativus]|uniref:Uncharacterized protein n=1 Tax=Daucus carota subsp. sativus TaxID=79200 RepID=A0A164Z4Z5_DAUCS|nr:hypothetical protein DCAR_0521260 [Daucus carota subsp. sativus]
MLHHFPSFLIQTVKKNCMTLLTRMPFLSTAKEDPVAGNQMDKKRGQSNV